MSSSDSATSPAKVVTSPDSVTSPAKVVTSPAKVRDTWVVIPLYNEEQVIGEVIAQVRTTFEQVVCVDDGSSDRSGDVAARAGARVVRHPVNLGQGAALQTGFEYALADPSMKYVITFDGDGYLWHHGRADDIMNAGGYRVSPLEVEAALMDCPGIAEVAVGEYRPRDDVSIIAAYVVRRDGGVLDADAILAHARTRLAAYKQPRQIFFVDALPRGSNGKLLRRGLTALAIPGPDA